MRVGVCTGGGDCPGLNAAIRAIVKACIRNGYEVYGIQDCFQGLKANPPLYQSLEISDVTDIYFKGGTILGTYSKSGRSDVDEKIFRANNKRLSNTKVRLSSCCWRRRYSKYCKSSFFSRFKHYWFCQKLLIMTYP